MDDVIVIGYGPTGMLAAILLGRAGHRVTVLERYRSLYNLPRVGIVHDDVLRMFQDVGIVGRVASATHFLPRYELAHGDEILLSNAVEPHAAHGWPEFTSIYQPAFEAELDREARRFANVDVRQGARVIAIAQDDGGVTVTFDDGAGGAAHEARARYVIAADGGNSFVRHALLIGMDDLGFDQDWLVIDARLKRDDLAHTRPPLRQFCDPQQPGMTMQMGPNHRRWSFMIFPGEAREDAMRPENVWRRLARPEGGTPDDFELVRVASYRFQSRVAQRWRAGRIFLAGDAAHLMPPFLAQGLCSGFRDAQNLTWKLDLVLRDLAGADLLDAYEREREPNARAVTIESMRVGQNVNERDPHKVAQRDATLRALQAQKAQGRDDKTLIAFRVPGVAAGLIAQGEPGAGDVFPQTRVRRDGPRAPWEDAQAPTEGLFDDCLGRGFLIVCRRGDPLAGLSADQLAFWTTLGGQFVELAPADGPAPPRAWRDIEGRLAGLMDALGCDVLLKRPDDLLFGAAREAAGLPALMDRLRQVLA